MAFAISSRGLLRCSLPRPNRQHALDELLLPSTPPQSSDQLVPGLVSQFTDYFAGKRIHFELPLDLASATNFEREVWQAARAIPYGETRSYSWLARQIGKPGGARAVGQALGRNPLPIIVPCHRVLTSSGQLGGFSGGLEMKRYLLKLEQDGRA